MGERCGICGARILTAAPGSLSPDPATDRITALEAALAKAERERDALRALLDDARALAIQYEHDCGVDCAAFLRRIDEAAKSPRG
jgi:hypothetical protein